jgi:hypothetical protein
MIFGETIKFDARMNGVLPAPCPEVDALLVGKRFPLFRMEKKRPEWSSGRAEHLARLPLREGSMAGLRHTGR